MRASAIPALVALVVYFAGRKFPREFLAEVPMFSKSCLTLVLALASALVPQARPRPQAGAQPAIPELEFLVKERRSDTTGIDKLEVKEGDPAQVASFGLRALPPGTAVSDLNFKVDATTRTRAIDGAIAQLNEFYVFPETAKKMGDAVKARQKKGEYDSITDGDAFAKMLTENFQEVSHDKHLSMDFSPAPMPERPEGPRDADAVVRYHKDMERMKLRLR